MYLLKQLTYMSVMGGALITIQHVTIKKYVHCTYLYNTYNTAHNK